MWWDFSEVTIFYIYLKIVMVTGVVHAIIYLENLLKQAEFEPLL